MAYGGGVINITTTTLTVAGSITANGGPTTLGSGGGAGGSIFIFTSSLQGSGSITSNGGIGGSDWSSPTFYGGGGGGGRIAIHYTTSSFTGTLSAAGGEGPNTQSHGGPGTIFTQDYTTGTRKLTVNNNNLNVVTKEIESAADTRGSIAWLASTSIATFEVDEISISGNAGLAMFITSGAKISLYNK